MGSTTHYRACNLCEAICGLEITVEDGRVRDIRGDKADPLSRGFVCPKATALADLEADPDRLRRPWLREGTRGARSAGTRPSVWRPRGCTRCAPPEMQEYAEPVIAELRDKLAALA